jgi:hypothetical protein
VGEKEKEEKEKEEKKEEEEKVEDIQDKFKTNSRQKSKPHWNTGKLTNMASKEETCY